nr:uncharacterized protein LOC116147500 [Camelus dromedarius]
MSMDAGERGPLARKERAQLPAPHSATSLWRGWRLVWPEEGLCPACHGASLGHLGSGSTCKTLYFWAPAVAARSTPGTRQPGVLGAPSPTGGGYEHSPAGPLRVQGGDTKLTLVGRGSPVPRPDRSPHRAVSPSRCRVSQGKTPDACPRPSSFWNKAPPTLPKLPRGGAARGQDAASHGVRSGVIGTPQPQDRSPLGQAPGCWVLLRAGSPPSAASRSPDPHLTPLVHLDANHLRQGRRMGVGSSAAAVHALTTAPLLLVATPCAPGCLRGRGRAGVHRGPAGSGRTRPQPGA